jgi:anaerobic selenocysteine-containing dehydrogenase
MAARFFHRLGASLLDRTICANAGGEALAATYGGKLGMRVEQFVHSRLILIWGSNPITSSVHFWTFAQQAKRAGAKLVCIDPRRTETAEKCHQHIALLPGTDGALALGLMHELVMNGWLDHDYIARLVDGWEKLRDKALAWPPERTAAVWTLLERANLTPKELTVVMQRFGLDSSHEWRTLAEVARQLDCSREYCRQVLQRALRKLRKTGIDSGLVEAE